VLDHHAADMAERVRAATGGRGPEIVLEMLTSANLERDLALLAPHGRVVVIGSRGRIEIDPLQTMMRELSILGVGLLNATLDELREIHAALREGLATGALRPVVREVLPLAEAARAHRLVLAPGAEGSATATCGSRRSGSAAWACRRPMARATTRSRRAPSAARSIWA
jgi:NADPH2:quinone reductase